MDKDKIMYKLQPKTCKEKALYNLYLKTNKKLEIALIEIEKQKHELQTVYASYEKLRTIALNGGYK